MIGVPSFTNECTIKQMHVSFARLLIAFDVTMFVPRMVVIKENNGNAIKQQIHYNLVSPFVKNVRHKE